MLSSSNEYMELFPSLARRWSEVFSFLVLMVSLKHYRFTLLYRKPCQSPP
jgi:hypothetical protein